MPACKVTNDIYSVGILNPGMRIFDVVMKTEYGTSYNSYIVKGKEKTALIEASHATYSEQYINNIKEVCPPEKIDYIILNHCEPDHSGALTELVKHCPNAQVVLSKAGAIYIKNITNNPGLPVKAVKDGDVLDLGGRVLSFISTPFLHWPDTMFTLSQSDKILFSCDFLGCHFCEPYTFDYNISHPLAYEKAFEEYYNAILAPFRPYVAAGMAIVKGLDIETVCTSHGPILTKGNRLEYAVEKYDLWSRANEKTVKSIPVFYCSAYGNTGKIAAAIRNGIKDVISDADTEIYNLNDYSMDELQKKLNGSDAFAVGSPTINADAVAPVWALLSHVDVINNKKRPALAFGSFGWSGEAVPNMTARLNGLKSKVFDEGFRVTFVPTEQDLERARALGRAFAESLL